MYIVKLIGLLISGKWCKIYIYTASTNDTIRYEMQYVRSKANMSQLIYRTEPTTKKCRIEKLKSRKQICSEITANSLGNPRSES